MPTATFPATHTDTAVRRLRAIGDDTRMGILLQLAGGEQCVCDLSDALAASQSLLSFHLRTLREAGMVTDRRVGRWVHYAIHPAGFAELERFLRALRQGAAGAPPCQNRCCQ
jgi:ArsR family transcriptional regulator